MICRLWRGVVSACKAEEYRAYQLEVGPPGYRKIRGNVAAYMLGRRLSERYEIAMVTLWDSWESVRAFAGNPVDAARYYDRDFDFLIDPPETVEHFEVRLTANVAGQEEKGSILRLWRSRVCPERLEEARRWEVELGVPGYRQTEGNQGIYFLERLPEEHCEVGMLTFWRSYDAVRRFAGDPLERADYDEYHRRGLTYLVNPPEEVEHFDVLFAGREPAV